ncbi:diguanylate cyclase [Roseibium hamelinense]|nr:diguanylate cyclase [Roseibium hamelinense]
MIAVTSASLVFVGYVASEASNRQAIENERALFANALHDRLRLIIREQTTTARWDLAVENIVRDFDVDFVRDKLGDLWTNYHHSKVMIVAGANRIKAESFREYMHITDRPLSETPALVPIVEQVRKLYFQNRVRVPGGFSHQSLQGLPPQYYAALGYAMIDGKPAMVGAMPIMPHLDTVTLPDGPPAILISAKYIEGPMMEDLNSQLSFTNLSFSSEPASTEEAKPQHTVTNFSGLPLGHFHWQSTTQVTSIWPTVVPVVFVLSMTLALLAFFIAWRIGKLTSSLHASERQNRYLALHDTLSGLANRLQFNRVLGRAVDDLPANPFAVLHCDLDKFKQVNDTHGHAAGDAVIKAMADRLSKAIAENGLVARVGGDEFVIILKAFADRRRLEILATRLIELAQMPIDVGDGVHADIGLSIGIAIAPEAGTDPEALMAASDAALYLVKENGRGRAAFYGADGPELMEEKPRPKEQAA